nr:MAG TPA: hypothetical protein [Caudoviricetes sp.]
MHLICLSQYHRPFIPLTTQNRPQTRAVCANFYLRRVLHMSCLSNFHNTIIRRVRVTFNDISK